MRNLLSALADTIRWGEPWSFEDDDDVVIIDARTDEIPSTVTPGAVIAL